MPLRPLALLLAAGAPAWAEAPRVVADIAPVHSIAARVMEGIGTPDLLIPPGVSPHDHALRPSEAAALQGADLVLRVGDALTPGLGGRIDTLSEGEVLILAEVDGVSALTIRADEAFEAHGRGDRDEDHGGDLDDHAEEAADGDGDEHGHGHDHEAGGLDPHLWLDPANAVAWTRAIAGALAARDPANAGGYAANAAAAEEELAALVEEVAATLAPVRDRPVIVFHDAYQYFEAAFGLDVAGAIAVSDAAPPGPARLSAIRETARVAGVACLFAEPQFDPGLVAVVAEGTDLPVATLDPLGTALEPGPELYPALLRGLAEAAATCAG